MNEILRLLLPFFVSQTNYDEMLKKLGACLFWEVWILTFIFRSVPSVDSAFQLVEGFKPIGNALSTIPNHQNLNIEGFLLAIFIAFLSHEIQLHDIISDLFGIRRQFDRNYILLPLLFWWAQS